MKRYFFIGLIITALFAACFEEDSKVPPYPGLVSTIDHDITFYQSYFDFETNSVVKIHHRGEWDMAFGCDASSWHVRINSGNEMFVFRSALIDLNEPYNITGNEEWLYDNPSGCADSSAVGAWCNSALYPCISNNKIYVMAEKGVQGYREYIRFQMISADSSGYQIQYRKPAEPAICQLYILKNDSFNFTYYSFKDEIQKNTEPLKNTYDIVFMPYYELVYGIVAFPMPYLVRGTLLNTNGAEACMQENVNFENIDYGQVLSADFEARQNIIGWDWKDVNIDFSGGTATYNIKTNRVYIVKSVEGNYFKLRFLSYKLEGSYGYPRFEFRLISP
ncbi:MAG: HmuY family protein [Bacteroidales bacterium]